jgi:membrane dipeptidase
MPASESTAIAPIDRMAARLGVSEEAVAICRRAEVIDLHLDTFIPMRIFGYRLAVRHGLGLLRGRFFGHLDLPRLTDGGLSGGMWSITTNPFRTASGRWRAFQRNLERIRGAIAETGGRLRLARSAAEYREARADGAHACLLAVQGGNCFDAAPGGLAAVVDRSITRVTIVHLLNSALGVSSVPVGKIRRARGLTPKGRAFVEQCDAERVFVDLAHIHPDGFWDAVDVHDRSLPLIATHTGVSAVTPHWRNLTDDQLRAIADTGGTVGIIYSTSFVGSPRAQGGQAVVEHMQHVVDAIGEDFVSIGSDYDGAIIPPADLRSGDSYPRLVQHMLDRRWSIERIEKVLGKNFLRAFEGLRPA